MFQVGQRIRWITIGELSPIWPHTSAGLLTKFKSSFPEPLTVCSVSTGYDTEQQAHIQLIGVDAASPTLFHEKWFKPITGFSLNSI